MFLEGNLADQINLMQLKDFLLAGFFKLCWGAFIIFGAFYFVRSLVAFVQKKGDETEGFILAGIYYFIHMYKFVLFIM